MSDWKQSFAIIVVCVILGVIVLGALFGLVHLIETKSNEAYEMAAFKYDVFTALYPDAGEAALEIEHDVEQQIVHTRAFLQEYRTPEGKKYIYTKGDNSRFIEIITNGAYRVNKSGKYVLNK